MLSKHCVSVDLHNIYYAKYDKISDARCGRLRDAEIEIQNLNSATNDLAEDTRVEQGLVRHTSSDRNTWRHPRYSSSNDQTNQTQTDANRPCKSNKQDQMAVADQPVQHSAPYDAARARHTGDPGSTWTRQPPCKPTSDQRMRLPRHIASEQTHARTAPQSPLPMLV